MDITSYLLGKKSGGGGGSSGFDWEAIGYERTPKGLEDAYNYAKQIQENWDSTITSCSQLFDYDYNLVYFPLVDTSNVTKMYQMFTYDYALQKVPTLNMDNVDNFSSMYNWCYNLKEVGDIELKTTGNSSINASMAFQNTAIETAPKIKSVRPLNLEQTFRKCSYLKTVPVWQIGTGGYGINSMNNTFLDCPLLTDESLNNIMATIKNAPNYNGTKTLKYIGFNETQATTCTTLSNWSSLEATGWTTGY